MAANLPVLACLSSALVRRGVLYFFVMIPEPVNLRSEKFGSSIQRHVQDIGIERNAYLAHDGPVNMFLDAAGGGNGAKEHTLSPSS